jgi:DNA-3-methyladenine glycosylase
MILREDFFDRIPTRVARDLLGKVLVRETGEGRKYLLIADTEAYAGSYDLASHARFGKTARNASMYGRPGRWYVYMAYGMHYLLNAVARGHGTPSAVLVRGGYALAGPRKKAENHASLLAGAPYVEGPGRVAAHMGIGKDFNGEKMGILAGLWIEDWGVRPGRGEVRKSPRIGVAYAGEWAHKDWRFTYRPRLAP